MTEKFPHDNEFQSPRDIFDESSALLNELAKIRREIEQDSMSSQKNHLSSDLARGNSAQKDGRQPSMPISPNGTSDIGNSYTPDSLRQYYRFDFEHTERTDTEYSNNEPENTFWERPRQTEKPKYRSEINFNELPNSRDDKKLLYSPELEKPTRNQIKNSPPVRPQRQKPQTSIIKENQKNYDDPPVVIPIRQPGTQNFARNTNAADKIPSTRCPVFSEIDANRAEYIDLSALPWRFFSQYENETFVKMAGNASNLSLFIGWGAIACGVMIFVRSFFVSSMIWLSYGLPILSLGAVCLFMGILLSILSEKMQQINELKQTLTKHRILNPSRQKFDPPHEAHLRGHGGTHGSVEKTLEKNQQMPPEPPPSINSHDHGASAPMHTHQNENAELEDVYDRLLKLRSDVNELIDECEHPES